jgi:predicted TPR repeat methyltransferase
MDFDRFAEAYEHEVEEAIRFARLPPEFFLEVKVAHLLEKLKQKFEDFRQLRVLDVGCGVGLTDQLLNAHLPHLVGVDI